MPDRRQRAPTAPRPAARVASREQRQHRRRSASSSRARTRASSGRVADQPDAGADHAADAARARPRSGPGPARRRTAARRCTRLTTASVERHRAALRAARAWRRRSVAPSRTTPMTITSRNGRLLQERVRSVRRSRSRASAAPSAPTASAGRNGRMPTAAATPIPWKMSKTRCTVLYRDRGDDRRDGSVSPGGLERDPDPSFRPAARIRPHRTAPRSSARDIQRYAALFAQRTKVMQSSAMRDLMALTERDDVISLAGGLPGHLDLPARLLRGADEHDRRRVVRPGAPVRPDRGLRPRQGLHRRGDGAPRAWRSTPTSCW